MLVQPLSYLDNDSSFLSLPPSCLLVGGWVGGRKVSCLEAIALSGHSYTILDALRVSGSYWMLTISFC